MYRISHVNGLFIENKRNWENKHKIKYKNIKNM